MKYILFDLDGTLTDSGEGIMHCAELTLAHYALPIPPRSEMRSMVGPPLRDSFRRFGIPEADMDDAVAYYRQHYSAIGQFENEPYPGIAEMLSTLLHQGQILCIATSKPEEMAKNILAHFDLARFFTHICGAIPGGRSTKSEVLSHLLQLLPETQNAWMVGDTIYDVEGAACHHLPCIAVSWGYGQIPEMKAAGAAIASSTDQLLAMLNA